MREASAGLEPMEDLKIVMEIQEIMKAKEANWRAETEKAKAEARCM
jgi:hypothetical protein